MANKETKSTSSKTKKEKAREFNIARAGHGGGEKAAVEKGSKRLQKLRKEGFNRLEKK